MKQEESGRSLRTGLAIEDVDVADADRVVVDLRYV
jgi:hypothetical protein